MNGPVSTLYGVPDRLLGTVRSVRVETRAPCRGDLQWTPPTPPINSPPHAPPPRPGLYAQRPSNTLGWPLMPEVLRSGGCYDRYRCPSVQCSGLKPQKHFQGSRKFRTLCDSLYRPWWGGSYIKSVTVTCHKLYFECGFLCCTILPGPTPNNGAIRTMRCMGKITLGPPTPLMYWTP